MSDQAHLPKYLVGRWGHHLQLFAPDLTDAATVAAAGEQRHFIGEYHCWTPRALDSDDPPQPDDLMFIVMRQARIRTPHPAWQALPHVYRRTTIADHHAQTLSGYAKAAFDKAQRPDKSYVFGPLVIQPHHDVVELAFSLAAIHPGFEP